jgi:hypothetical protein
VRRAEPERELIRRVTPFLLPAVGVAFALGAALGGPNDGWSTAIAVAVVTVNFVGAGLSFAWAATISPMALAAVGVVGFFVRMTTILVLMIALNRLDWFSPIAFAAAVVPATAVLLMFEMKVLSGRMQADMWSVGETSR